MAREGLGIYSFCREARNWISCSAQVNSHSAKGEQCAIVLGDSWPADFYHALRIR
jgi:hypothetical protein